MSARPSLYLVDGSAQIHRAFFAIRGLSTVRGLPTGAIYGFTTMLRKLMQDERPRHMGIAFDVKGKTFRHEQYPEYKANRPKMDDDLAVQLPWVRRVCDAFRLSVVEVEGVEADDVIATLARQGVEAGMRVVVVSADKDLLQLVGDHVVVLNPGREGTGATLFDAARVEEKWSVPPERIADVLALMGDSVDNVPGVPGIGEKGARDIIKRFGSLEAALDGAEDVKRKSYREGLQQHREEALLSKRLVTLRDDLPISLDLASLAVGEPDRKQVFDLFTELEFTSLAGEYAPEATASTVQHSIAGDVASLSEALEAARVAGRVALAPMPDGRAPRTAGLVGLALSWEPGRAVYVPLRAAGLGEQDAMDPEEASAALKPLLEDPEVDKLSAHSKRDLLLLGNQGITLKGVGFDALLAGYLLQPGRRAYSLADAAREYLHEHGAPSDEAGDVDADGLSRDATARATAADAELVLRLGQNLDARLEGEGLDEAYHDLELPLVPILASMERVGVRLDVDLLRTMSQEMESRVAELTTRIHELAGGEFNLNSPPQLREVLFDRLGLKSAKKTAKTRAASTAEDVLEELAQHHELPALILEYRGTQKLKSTYVDALPQLVDAGTGRVHATFNQTVAATGRLSASDPNLQNIPIRTPEGRRIREAFIAEDGWRLLSADYSQIELRVLAHLCQDPTLVDAFNKGEDIHDRTSREIFGPFSPIPAEEQRRRSKMVNYALLYGKTAFTLAKDLGVSRKEAESFIEAYFARYPGVKTFIDETIAEARRTGQVRTLLGRLRRLPDLKARSYPVRMEAERQAMNTPIQGSAADLIKKAMLDLDAALEGRKLRTRLILQIHDELLLETPEDEADEALALVKQVMENALELAVPLVVDARLGQHWGEVH
jgi:DNA polymerase-1